MITTLAQLDEMNEGQYVREWRPYERRVEAAGRARAGTETGRQLARVYPDGTVVWQGPRIVDEWKPDPE